MVAHNTVVNYDIVICCEKRANIEDIARPAAVLSLFIFISLSVLATLHLGWGVVFTMILGFIVYGLLFGALFLKKCVRLFLALFVVFEAFKVLLLFTALMLGIVSIVEKYTELSFKFVVCASVYFPLNLAILWVFFKYYKATADAEITVVARDIEAPAFEVDRPPNYQSATAESLERQSQSSQLPSYEEVVKGTAKKGTVAKK